MRAACWGTTNPCAMARPTSATRSRSRARRPRTRCGSARRRSTASRRCGTRWRIRSTSSRSSSTRRADAMPGDVNRIFTKVLIPFVEKEVGPEGVAAVLRTVGRSREYLVADHNWLPLPLANELVRLAMELMGETDEERWARRYTEYLMEWRPPRADRHYLRTYPIGLGRPTPTSQRRRQTPGPDPPFLRSVAVA